MIVLCGALALALAACGSAGKSALTTASVKSKPQNVNTPSARATQVGWTSARAVKCGFYFDPERLRAQYIAFEQQNGLAGNDLKRVELTYKISEKTIQQKLKDNADYCKKPIVVAIQKDLQRHLGGDYTPAPRKPKKVVAKRPWFQWGSAATEKFDRRRAFDPKGKRPDF